MTTVRKLTPEEIGSILQKGDFAELVATVEYESLECKNALYDLKLPVAKIELAKDVSALANAKGGHLLLRVSTKKNATHKGDEITEVSCFAENLCDLDQYRKILQELIYPPIRGLKLKWHPSASNASIEIVSIYVTPEGCQDRPYLISQVEIGGNVSGRLFGYFERIESNVEPMRVHELRERLKDGMRYRDMARKLESIESLLVRQSTESAGKKTATTIENLIQRAVDTKIATGVDGARRSLRRGGNSRDHGRLPLHWVREWRDEPACGRRARPCRDASRTHTEREVSDPGPPV